MSGEHLTAETPGAVIIDLMSSIEANSTEVLPTTAWLSSNARNWRHMPWAQLIFAVTSVALATYTRALIDPLFGEKFPYITYLAATSGVAWYCGYKPATLTLILGFLSAFYFFASPRGSFYVSGIDAQVGALSYIATGVGSIFLFHSVQTAEKRSRESADHLRHKQAVLENEINERKAAQQSVVKLLRKLVLAQEEERHRISRELHDQCGQDLTALRLSLKLLEDSIASEPASHAHCQTMAHLIDRIAQEIHTLALKLRPPELDDIGLVPAIRNHLHTWCEITGVGADFESRINDESMLSIEVETALYRILQEALTNIAKHAGAGHVNIVLMSRENGIDLIIEDDGCGFEIARSPDNDMRITRLGLLGMQERLQAIGGSLEIETSPGTGTTVFAKVRLDQPGKS